MEFTVFRICRYMFAILSDIFTEKIKRRKKYT